MKEIKNKIITISGEPVSGKSTVVKLIRDKYEKMGNKVQIISVGNIFRQLIQEEYYRTYPDRKNVSLTEIQTDEDFKEKRNQIDQMVDGEIARRGQLINQTEQPNNVYIIDSRLAWNNIPDSYAVRLTVNENIAGKRVFDDQTRGVEDKFISLDEAIEQTRKRKLSEIQRYKERYGVDLTNPDNYDLIVDTSFSNPRELAQIIVEGEQNYRTGKYYPKTWKSPALFLPAQNIRDTIGTSAFGNNIEGLTESIKKNGYDFDAGEVTTLEYEGNTYLKEGHHRTIAALAAGKTLIPYYTEHKDDEYTKTFLNNGFSISDYYDWEETIRSGAKLGGIHSLENFDILEYFDIVKLVNRNKRISEPNQKQESSPKQGLNQNQEPEL